MNDARDVVHVDTARGDVRRDESASMFRALEGQRARGCALGSAPSAREGRDEKTCILQQSRQLRVGADCGQMSVWPPSASRRRLMIAATPLVHEMEVLDVPVQRRRGTATGFRRGRRAPHLARERRGKPAKVRRPSGANLKIASMSLASGRGRAWSASSRMVPALAVASMARA